MEGTTVTHAAVRVDIEGADEPEPRVVDIKDRFVRAEAQAIGIDGVLHDEPHLALRGEAEHGLYVEVPLQVLSDHAGDHQPARGIGPIDSAVGTHDDIVRAVEFLALIARRDGDERAVLLHPPDRPRRPARNVKSPLPIERHAVGMIRRMDQDAFAHARRPPPDRVADDIDPQQALVAPIPDRAFAKGEAVRDRIELRVGADNPFEPRCREVDVHSFALPFGRDVLRSIGGGDFRSSGCQCACDRRNHNERSRSIESTMSWRLD